jgi:hypothetical protein
VALASLAISILLVATTHAAWGDTHAARQGADAPETLLARAREAVGGQARLARLQSLVLTGVLRALVVGGTEVGKVNTRRLEIKVRLPEDFLQSETRDFGEDGSVTHRYGLSGATLLNEVRTVGEGVHYGGSWGPDQLPVERARFTRLLLGSLALEGPLAPLRFADAGVAQHERRAVRVLRVTGPSGFDARLLLDATTFLPVALVYTASVRLPEPPKPGTDPGRPMVFTPPPAQRLEVVFSFGDRRLVGGLRFPHRLVKMAGGFTLEEIVIEKVVVNPPLTKKDFVS